MPALPRTTELAAVVAVVYPVDRLYAHFLAPATESWPFLVRPVPFLAVLLSFLVLVYVPAIKSLYARLTSRWTPPALGPSVIDQVLSERALDDTA